MGLLQVLPPPATAAAAAAAAAAASAKPAKYCTVLKQLVQTQAKHRQTEEV